MMLQRSSPDDGAAAVARLTAKERECLDRWLGHATAKEIALELGITHHAVEKRLKSARAKLGVTTTLDAARLLASVEGYGRTVSQSPEVGTDPLPGHEEGAAAPDRSSGRRRRWIITGVSLMSLIVLAALIFTAQPQPDTVIPRAELDRKVVVVNRKDGKSSVELNSALASAFGSLDKNDDGFVAGEELTAHNFILRTHNMIRPGESTPAPEVTGLGDFDRDSDKRVSRAEFFAGMNALTARTR